MENHFLKVKNLYKTAKNIFGDIVISAYVQSYDKKELQKIAEKYKSLKDNATYLSYDGDIIILEFKNGNKVRFTNSEWASISKCEDF